MQPFLEAYPFGSHRAALAPVASDYVDARILAANAPEVHSIAGALAAGARFVSLSTTGGADLYVRFGAPATVPEEDVADGSASELATAVRRIPEGVTTIGLAASAPCIVTLSFWS